MLWCSNHLHLVVVSIAETPLGAYTEFQTVFGVCHHPLVFVNTPAILLIQIIVLLYVINVLLLHSYVAPFSSKVSVVWHMLLGLRKQECEHIKFDT